MESVKIKKLFKQLPVDIRGSKEVAVSGLSADSRSVAPGDIFFAKRGSSYDGSDFIQKAVEAKAHAIVTDLYNPFLENVVQIITEDVAQIEAEVAKRYYQNPSKDLFTVGVTATAGKTTVSYLLHHLFEKMNHSPCGLIGTIEYILGSNRLLSNYTTPDILSNFRFLKEMLNHHCTHAVMEASSHGLDQGRLKNIELDRALFMNLSHEHLDYHESMDKYFEAKWKIFSHLKTKGMAILNVDDPKILQNSKRLQVPVLTFAINHPADVRAENIVFDLDTMTFDIVYQNNRHSFRSHLIGEHNVYNLLAAITVGISCKYSMEDMKKAVEKIMPVRGRMEKISLQKGATVLIDYAHKPQALEQVLASLQKIKKGKIITVFGCGGNRDQQKRPQMAQIASQYSDYVIVTNDNPRKEDPSQIIKEICEGFPEDYVYEVREDRFKAIKKAIEMAAKNDMILIAGKGHETHQILSDNTIFFDDRETVMKIGLE